MDSLIFYIYFMNLNLCIVYIFLVNDDETNQMYPVIMIDKINNILTTTKKARSSIIFIFLKIILNIDKAHIILLYPIFDEFEV